MYETCNGKIQSPIDINTDSVVYDSNLPKIRLVNYENAIYWNVTNSDKTVTLSPTIKSNFLAPKLYGGNDNSSEGAPLIQIHFHWGLNNYQGCFFL